MLAQHRRQHDRGALIMKKVLRYLIRKWDEAQQRWYEQARADLQEKMKNQRQEAQAR